MTTNLRQENRFSDDRSAHNKNIIQVSLVTTN